MTESSFRLALAQANATLGDVAGNADLVRAARREAALAGAVAGVGASMVAAPGTPLGQVDPALMSLIRRLAYDGGSGGGGEQQAEADGFDHGELLVRLVGLSALPMCVLEARHLKRS